MNEELKEIYELNNSLLRLAENLQDEFTKRGIRRETLSADLFLLCFFFTKASKTASAVVSLCKEGYTEDAFVLVRTIFEIVVKSLYIFKSDAIERARAFILYDRLERKKQLKKIVEWNRKRMIENREFEEELKKIETECNSLEKDYQISIDKVIWPRKNLEELSTEVDLANIYYTVYWLSSLYTYTSIRSSMAFVSVTDKGLSFDIKPDKKLSKDVLIYLFDLFIRMVQEFDHRFELGYQNNISELKEKFGKFMHKQDNVGTGI
jgi:hypothetical protein